MHNLLRLTNYFGPRHSCLFLHPWCVGNYIISNLSVPISPRHDSRLQMTGRMLQTSCTPCSDMSLVEIYEEPFKSSSQEYLHTRAAISCHVGATYGSILVASRCRRRHHSTSKTSHFSPPSYQVYMSCRVALPFEAVLSSHLLPHL